MSKINVQHFAAGNNRLYIIDDRGDIWTSAAGGAGQWQITSAIPDRPQQASPAPADAGDLPQDDIPEYAKLSTDPDHL